MDFTLSAYKQLLFALRADGFCFQTFQEYIKSPQKKVITFRHDVDRNPMNALVIATIEREVSISASYYFRIAQESYDEDIIKKIAEMEHEIGYHYEDFSMCNGDDEVAIRHFENNLNKFRDTYPVKTVCMHGSPLSKWDNRDLWKKYNYRDFGIIGEPYFDVDFNDVFYLTDTGRRWDGENVSVRDKVKSQQETEKLRFRYTRDIIKAAEKGLLPDKILINTHPQRWNDSFVPWAKELVWQNVKNVVKRYIVIKRSAEQ